MVLKMSARALSSIIALVLLSAVSTWGLAATTPLSQEPQVLTPEPLAAQDIKIADLDGDGTQDIAIACYNAPNVVYLNVNADFSEYMKWQSTESDYSMSVALPRISGSLLPDLFVGNSIGQSNRAYLNSAGSLSTSASWSSTDERWTNVVLPFDFDSDGYVDIFCGGSGENVIYRNVAGSLSPDPYWLSPMRIETRAAVIGEVNGDGVEYLAVGNVGRNYIYRISDGLPEDEPFWTSPDWKSTYSLDFGDYDADGDLDLAVGNLDGYDQVFENVDGSFGEAADWTSAESGATRVIRWCDLSEDGYPDLVVAKFRSQPNAVYSNSGGTIETSPSWTSEDEEDTTSLLCLDLDSNGSLDIVAANQDGYAVAYLSLLHSGPFVLSTAPEDGDTAVSRIAQITVSLYDYDDDIDLDTVELLVNGGVVSFSVTSTSAGATVQYAPTAGYPPTAPVRVTVRASDKEGNAMPEHQFSFTTTENTSPMLSSGVVTPTSGDTTSNFIYSVKYSDADRDSPAKAKAVVVSEYGQEYELDMQTISSLPYDGTYQAATGLPMGSYYYYFEFEDAYGASVVLPDTGYYSGPEVDRSNTEPMLSSPTLSPPSGTSETSFTFSVHYWDTDMDAASTAKIIVKSTSKEYSYNMVLKSGSGHDGTYSYCTSLPAGTYTHRFEFTDTRGAEAKLPSFGYYSGPVVTGENAPCVLSYGGVEPSLGSTNTEFTFRVHYFDADGDVPSASTLYFKTEMTLSARLTLGNGLLYDGDYTYTTKLSSQVQWYYFYVVNKKGDVARLPAEGYFYGPNLAGEENASLLSSGGVDPILGDADDTFTFSVHYYDEAGAEPQSAEVHVEATSWSATEMMEPVSGESPSNGSYEAEIVLGQGSYQYYFVFTDSQGTQIWVPDTGTFSGPFVGTSNHTPSLTNAAFEPSCGTADGAFTFSVHYFDQDGDAPGIASLLVKSGDRIVSYRPILTADTAANGTYSAEISLAAGETEYKFRFVDTKGASAAYPEAGWSGGPIVGDFDIALNVNSEVLAWGDILTLSLDLKNKAETDVSVTLGIGVFLPTGDALYFPNWGATLTGLQVSVPAGFEVAAHPVLSMTVPESAPLGAYVAYAAIFGPDNGFDCTLSAIASASWSIEAAK